MTAETFLIIAFRDSDGKERTLKISDPVSDLSLETVTAVADLICTKHVLLTSTGATYETFLNAYYRTVTVQSLVSELAE